MEKAPKKITTTDIINAYGKKISSDIATEALLKEARDKKFGEAIRNQIYNLVSALEINGLHLPEFITLESITFYAQGTFDPEKIRTIEYFKKDNQLIEVERVTTEVKDFPLNGITLATDISRNKQTEVIKELDSKSWIKYSPQIIQALKTLNQNKILQKS